MNDDDDALYAAFASRDPRFDGVFFTGVTSTGIYCRPVCTAKVPKRANCRFFTCAAGAEQAGFRPCLRCRPELAPGSAPVDGASRLATRIAHRISDGVLDDAMGMEDLAAEFHTSARQMRRVLQAELGVSPMQLVLTRRLLLAKQLLTDTELPVIEVAYASGFASLRRFNDAFRTRYGMPPTRLRSGATGDGRRASATDTLVTHLAYRIPFDWSGMLSFLTPRALPGVERIESERYARTVGLGPHAGWLEVRNSPSKRALEVTLSSSLAPVLPQVLARLKNLFDLHARPDLIVSRLGGDGILGASVAVHPGRRVPGAFDGFELAIRAILGQQVSVGGATTLAGRLVAVCGQPLGEARAGLTHLSPSAERIAATPWEEIAALGIVGSRARCVVALAAEVASGRLKLEAGRDSSLIVEKLRGLPGIGPWTAHYIAMRALHWPDSFPAEDLVLRKRLGGISVAEAGRISQAWSPWRSYAAMHLWQMQS